MRIVMVRYTVKEGRVAENEELVRAVYEQLAAEAPEGFRYATFREGRSFTHLASVTEGHENPLQSLTAFAEFQRGILERAEDAPFVSDLEAVGSYRLLDDLGTAP